MDAFLTPIKEELKTYLIVGLFGLILILSSFFASGVFSDLLLNVGATFLTTTILALFFQKLGTQRLTITQKVAELGVKDMWQKRRNVPSEKWNTFTSSAKTRVWLLGIAEQGFADDGKFRQIVLDGTKRGCEFRFLLLNPDSKEAKQIDLQEGGRQQVLGRIRGAICKFQDFQNCVENKNLVQIRLYSAVPQASAVIADDQILATFYTKSLVGAECFTIQLHQTVDGIFEQYASHFITLWESKDTVVVN